GAVGKEIHLAFLDPVLHLAAGAVDLFIKSLAVAVPFGLGERRHDKTRIGLTLGPFGFAHDTATAAPALVRRPHKLFEPPRRMFGLFAFGSGGSQVFADLFDETRIPGQAEKVVDTIIFTPGHQCLPAKAAVGSQDDASRRPTPAQAGDDTLHLVGGPGSAVDVADA